MRAVGIAWHLLYYWRLARDVYNMVNMTTLVEKAPLFQEARWSPTLAAALVEYGNSKLLSYQMITLDLSISSHDVKIVLCLWIQTQIYQSACQRLVPLLAEWLRVYSWLFIAFILFLLSSIQLVNNDPRVRIMNWKNLWVHTKNVGSETWTWHVPTVCLQNKAILQS